MRPGPTLSTALHSAVVNQAYGFIGLESNETGHWTVIDQGFMPALANIAAAAHGATIQAQVIEQTVNLSGASVTASVPIPADCIVLAVGARVTTAITGVTSYEVGVQRQPVAVRIGAGDRGWLVEFRSDRADRFLQQYESDHHGGWRLVHGRSGPPVDLDPSRESFRRVAAFSFQ